MKINLKKMTLVSKNVLFGKFQCQNTGCGKVYSSFGRYNCKKGGFCILNEV